MVAQNISVPVVERVLNIDLKKYFCLMCFSTTASFVASGVLAVTGTIALLKVKNPSDRLFAAIPLLFAIQQFSEGFVWFTMNDANGIAISNIAVYIFLFFALITWPIFLPLSILMMEKNIIQKKILRFLTLTGMVISLFMVYVIVFRNISAQAMFLHMHYNVDYPYDLPFISIMPYFIVTAIPQFISSVGKMKWFGLAIVASFLLTNIYFKENVPSVWCFFAALSSIIIILIVMKTRRTVINKYD